MSNDKSLKKICKKKKRCQPTLNFQTCEPGH